MATGQPSVSIPNISNIIYWIIYKRKLLLCYYQREAQQIDLGVVTKT